MPKLNPTKAAEVKKAGEDGGKFVLLPEGKYVVRLTDVTSETARSGSPMWVWKFETTQYLEVEAPVDNEGQPINVIGKEIWYRTVIMDKTLWDLDRVFNAFGVPPETDTDELVGDEIVVMIDQQVITGGKSKGKLGNNVVDFMTLANGAAPDDLDVLIGAAAGGKDDDPGF